MAAATAGIRGRAGDDTATTVKVQVWEHLAINDHDVEQQLFRSYVRFVRLEKSEPRGAIYVRIRYGECGEMGGGFARINCFFMHDDGRKFRMLETTPCTVPCSPATPQPRQRRSEPREPTSTLTAI